MHVLLVVQNSLDGKVVSECCHMLPVPTSGTGNNFGLSQVQSCKSVDNQVQQEHQYSDSISETICLEALSLLIS